MSNGPGNQVADTSAAGSNGGFNINIDITDLMSKEIGGFGVLGSAVELTAQGVQTLTEFAHILGFATLGLGTAIDLWSLSSPGTTMTPIHVGTNFGVGLYALSGGIFTAVPAAAYFLLDNFYPGGMPGALTTYGNIVSAERRYNPTAYLPGDIQ
jgi:hypothetical protein